MALTLLTFTTNRQRIALLAILSFVAMC